MKNMVVKAASKLRALRGAVGSQRGDVPGKVLVEVFNNAISKVAGMG